MRQKKQQAGRTLMDPNLVFGKMDTPRKKGRNLYDKQREEDNIRKAKEHGYFLNITKSYIEQNFAPETERASDDDGDDLVKDTDCPYLIRYLKRNVKRRDISRVYLVNLPRMHLRTLGEMGACKNLSICILCNNYINRFDALINCPNLTKMDLHGNQIVLIPDQYFWRSLQYLRFLHLHDNPIGSIGNLQNLAASPSLIALTVYDTPVSLRQSFRHHLVNSIWTLKALDHHVISDEELIEDAHFRGYFATMSTPFKINLCQAQKQETTFEEEIQLVRDMLRSIERILAHNSPVLIIQRYIRGHLARRKMQKLIFKMPSMPMQSPENITPRDSEETSEKAEEGRKLFEEKHPWNEQSADELRHTLQGDTCHPRMHQRVHIDMSRLQKTLTTLYNDSNSSIMYPELELEEQHERQNSGETKSVKIKKKGCVDPSKQTKFFDKSGDGLPLKEEGEEEQFYLQGTQKEPIYCDPMYYMMMEKKEIGSEVRLAVANYHRHNQVLEGQKVSIKQKKVTNEERYFQRTQATMGFSCLRAVQQAYRQRDTAEKKASKAQHVAALRQRREDGHFRVKLYKQEQRSAVIKGRVLDKYDIMNILRNQDVQKQKELELMRERKKKWEDLCKNKKDEMSFVRELSGSLMSLAKSQFTAKSSIDKEARIVKDKEMKMKKKSKKETKMETKIVEETKEENTTESEIQETVNDDTESSQPSS